jgi:hypothetical protein
VIFKEAQVITGLQTIVLFVSDVERNAGILDPEPKA